MMLLGLNGLGDDSLDPVMDSTVFSFDTSDPSIQIKHPAANLVSGSRALSMLWFVLSTASAALSGYHGYKRNNSVGWGIAWFALGGLFPVITPTIAFAQGFAKHK